MKNAFIISLLAIMLLQIFSKVLIVVDYQVNKEYIMEFLCINRDKPQLACEGKCHLSKKLKAQDAAEKQKDKQSQKQEVQVVLHCQELFAIPPFVQDEAKLSLPAYVSGQLPQTHFSVFHPPKSIV